MMTCQAARARTVRGLGDGGDPEATAHAAGCRACGAFARDAARLWIWLGEAALPESMAARRVGRRAGLIGLAVAALALVAVLAAVLFPSVMRGPTPTQEPEQGIELKWRALFPADFKGSRREVSARAAQVVESRLRKRDIAGTAALEGDDLIVVRLPNADGPVVADVKALLGRVGKCEVRPVRDSKDSTIPEGYEELRDTDDKQVAGRLPVHCLARKQPVATNEDVASAVEVASEGFHVVRIDFTKAGAAALDVAASEAFSKGERLGIVVDGTLVVAPYVKAAKLGGRIEVANRQQTGGREWARNLVTVLSMPPLPVAIGSVVEGKPVPGVPESERRY